MNRYGITTKSSNVFITTGSQQALDLIGKLLINPGDQVLVEEPTYPAALQAWNAYQAEYVGVACDDHGLRTDLLESALRVGPKFMYILPNFQNPGGFTLSLERRFDLVRLSNRYGIPLIEDDPYGALRFEGEHLPPLVALDSDYQSESGQDGHGYMQGNVIYLGTLSKTFSPGLRLGWVCAPEEVIDQLVLGKQGADLHSSGFDQMLAYEVLKDGFMDEHIQVIRKVYGERRDVMLAALKRYFPTECSWTRPEGGLFPVGAGAGVDRYGRDAEGSGGCQSGLRAGLRLLCGGGPWPQHDAFELFKCPTGPDRRGHPAVGRFVENEDFALITASKRFRVYRRSKPMERTRVRDIMSSPAITVSPDATLPAANALMKEKQIRHLPVLEKGRLVGIVSRGDLREASISASINADQYELHFMLNRLTVGKLMTRKVRTVTPDALVVDAADLMTEHKIAGLPVVDAEGAVIGIVTESDLLKMLVRRLREVEGQNSTGEA